MVTFKDFIDYFKDLAHRHSEIEHDVNNRRSFFNVDLIDIAAGLKSGIQKDKFTMILVNYNSILNEIKPGEKDINFFIVKDQKKGNMDANVEIRSNAEVIAHEIIAKIKEESTQFPRNPILSEMFRGSMDKIQDVHIIHTEIYSGAQKLIGVQCSFTNKFNYCPTIRPNIFNS